MIKKFCFSNLRNAEHFQFMQSAAAIFGKFGIDSANLNPLYDEHRQLLQDAEVALAFESHNEKVREKNVADRCRDNLHSKLFNFVKSILYDELDPRFGDAQIVMKVLKDVGNPTRLAENAESAMLTTLGNRLEPAAAQLEAIGATNMLADLLEANRKFIALEIACRELTADSVMNKPPSMSAVRKDIDTVYRIIVDAINGYARLLSKKEEYREALTEMNVLVAKYDALLASRKPKKNGELRIEN
jgi:hypothetical protein